MLQKFVAFAALTFVGGALLVPDATFARGGMGGGFHGGGFRAPAIIHRAPFMVRTGPAALGRNGSAFRPISSTLPPPIAKPPVHTHVGRPFAHLVQRQHARHQRFFPGYAYVYPFTTWDDGEYSGSYIGVPYDPGAAIPVYGPGPAIEPVLDPPARAPRIGMRDEAGEACRAERVVVPGDKDDREITIVRC